MITYACCYAAHPLLVLTCAADTAVVELKDFLLCLHDQSIIDAHLHNRVGECYCCSANGQFKGVEDKRLATGRPGTGISMQKLCP